jgi:hypothetical protein
VPPAYHSGVQHALHDLGLLKEAQTPITLFYRQRPNPLVTIARKMARIFKLKIPKFDYSKLIKRLFRNPFRIIGKQLSGKAPPIKL